MGLAAAGAPGEKSPHQFQIQLPSSAQLNVSSPLGDSGGRRQVWQAQVWSGSRGSGLADAAQVFRSGRRSSGLAGAAQVWQPQVRSGRRSSGLAAAGQVWQAQLRSERRWSDLADAR